MKNLKIVAMKKVLLIITILVFTAVSLFAQVTIKEYFPSLAKNPCYPIDSQLGQCVSSDDTEQHKLLAKALSEQYSFNWAESYLHPTFKKNLAKVYSSVLSDILPVQSVLYSRATVNSDGTYVISIKTSGTDIISFAIADDKICAILN